MDSTKGRIAAGFSWFFFVVSIAGAGLVGLAYCFLIFDAWSAEGAWGGEIEWMVVVFDVVHGNIIVSLLGSIFAISAVWRSGRRRGKAVLALNLISLLACLGFAGCIWFTVFREEIDWAVSSRGAIHRAIDQKDVTKISKLGENLSGDNLGKEGRTPLLRAILMKDRNIANALLSHKTNVDFGGPDQLGPLTVLAGQDDSEGWDRIEIATAMFQSGANPNYSATVKYSVTAKSPLLVAAEKGDRQFVSLLVAQGADPDQTGEWIADHYEDRDIYYEIRTDRSPDNKWNYLHYALHTRNRDMLGLLLDQGADLNKANTKGMTPLHLACYIGDADMFGMLVENGADMNKHDKYGYAVLHYLVEITPRDDWEDGFRFKAIDILIDAGADIEVRITHEPGPPGEATGNYLSTWPLVGYTPLRLVAPRRLSDREIVTCLLKHGANPREVPPENFNSLMVIGSNASKEEIRQWVKSIMSAAGPHAMNWAIRKKNTKVVKMLLEEGLDVNLPDERWYMGLQTVGEYPDSRLCRLLLDKGADPRITGRRKSPLFMAVEGFARDRGDHRERLEVVRLLLEAGASPMKTTYYNSTSVMSIVNQVKPKETDETRYRVWQEMKELLVQHSGEGESTR